MKNSLLWEFSRKGSKKRSFILGTMHVRSDMAFSHKNMILALIDSVHTYIGEMDLNDPKLSQVNTVFTHTDTDLEVALGPKKYVKTRRIILKSFGVDIDSLSHLKPIVIANALAESVLTKDHDLFLDGFLWNYAMEQNKHMMGLESVEHQADILEAIPLEYQVDALKQIAKNPSKFKHKTRTLAKAYEEQRLDDLYKMSKKSMGGLRKLMMYDRNERMAEKLVSYLDAHDVCVFVGVGAAHLAGKYGVLSLLKQGGFKVRSIH